MDFKIEIAKLLAEAAEISVEGAVAPRNFLGQHACCARLEPSRRNRGFLPYFLC